MTGTSDMENNIFGVEKKKALTEVCEKQLL